jgi:ribosomal protein S4
MGVALKRLKRAWKRTSIQPVRQDTPLGDKGSVSHSWEGSLDAIQRVARPGADARLWVAPLTYKHRLVEKQRIKAYLGGMKEYRFKRLCRVCSYTEFIQRTEGTLVQSLMQWGWARSPAESRQWILQGRLSLNGRAISQPHTLLQTGDWIQPSAWLWEELRRRQTALVEGQVQSRVQEGWLGRLDRTHVSKAQAQKEKRKARATAVSSEGAEVSVLPEVSHETSRTLSLCATSGSFWEMDPKTGCVVIVAEPKHVPYSEGSYRAAREFFV